MTYAIAGNGRGLSSTLWQNMDDADAVLINQDENYGYGVHPNLASFDVHADADAPTVFYGPEGARGYADSTSASITSLSSLMGGGVRCATGATLNEEAWVQWCGGAGEPFVISDTAARSFDLVMEWAVRATAADFANMAGFFGLAEGGSAGADFIADGGAMSDSSYIGWHWDANANVDFVYRKNGQAAQVHVAGWKTLVTATWYHFGVLWDASTLTITPYYGTGDRTTTAMASDLTSLIASTVIDDATFPDDEYLAPIFGCKNLGAANVSLDCRLLGVAQLAPAAD